MRRKRKMYPFIIMSVVAIGIIIAIIGILYHNQHSNDVPALEELEFSYVEGKTIATTYEKEEVLINPGKGFVLQDYFSDGYDNIVAIGYKRFNWCDIEPEEGKYNWELIDQYIEHYAQKGKKFAFGVMNANTSSNKEYVTPQWVFAAGAKGEEKQIQYTFDGKQYTKTQFIPDWHDAVFLEKVQQFVGALGERYDGNPHIAYIDIRSYGNWGEQHLGVIGGTDVTPEELQTLYIQPYQNSFANTLLVNPWGKSIYNEVYKASIDSGITIRRDGIFRNSDGTECYMAYGKLPSIFEYTFNYNVLKNESLWDQNKLLEYVEIGKPSYMQIYKEMYDENKDFCDMLANKMGYYFKFKGAEYTNSVKTTEENQITLQFINEGVAPLYEPCSVYIGLLDENYQLVKKYTTDIDPHTWMPEEEITENLSIQLDGVEDGKYILSLGLFLNENDEQPTYLLGNSGKTEDKWYVFGEIDIQNPQEEYTIQLENENDLVNAIDGYTANVQIQNVRKDAQYNMKIYYAGQLLKEVPIDNTVATYQESVTFAFEEGENTYTIQIEKNGDVVQELHKTVYVCNFMTEYSKIAQYAVEKYTEFETQFASGIAQIPGYAQRVANMKNYMALVEPITETILETSSIEAMELHYDLGNVLIQAYRDGTLQVEYVTLSSMLDMLDDIGNSYEDLVTVTAETRNPNFALAQQAIQEAETLINNNQDLDIIYPSKILEFSKDYNETANYIYNLEEENDIKTGLIMSKNLHSMLLANWAKAFAEVYIDAYIAQNPVTVEYSTMEWTNQDVIATLVTNANIQMQEGASAEYTFTDNGQHTFAYTIRGREFTIDAVVNNMDKIPPVIEGVEEGQAYIEGVIPVVTDDNLDMVLVYLHDQKVESYQLGDTIQEVGSYTIEAVDKAGNIVLVDFTIQETPTADKVTSVQYTVNEEERIITNIMPNTNLAQLQGNIQNTMSYQIVDKEGNTVTDTGAIGTGYTMQMENGSIYTLVVAGDVNGDGKANVLDVAKIQKVHVKMEEPADNYSFLACDLNADEKINLLDVARLQKLATGQSIE